MLDCRGTLRVTSVKKSTKLSNDRGGRQPAGVLVGCAGGGSGGCVLVGGGAGGVGAVGEHRHADCGEEGQAGDARWRTRATGRPVQLVLGRGPAGATAASGGDGRR